MVPPILQGKQLYRLNVENNQVCCSINKYLVKIFLLSQTISESILVENCKLNYTNNWLKSVQTFDNFMQRITKRTLFTIFWDERLWRLRAEN